MRKIGLDVGDVRIGIAVSDLTGMLANPRESYTRRGLERDLQYFADVAKAEQADAFVLGLPISMDGTEGKRVDVTREFADKLKEFTGLPVYFQDERLSTVSAEKMLIEGNVRREKRKQVIDKVAACIILQAWLDNPFNKK